MVCTPVEGGGVHAGVCIRCALLWYDKVTMARKKKPKLPSRVRYEADHPTITVRVPRSLFDTYKEQVEASGVSGAGWFKARLTQDQNAIDRQHQAAALRRDDLGQEIRELRRQRDSLRSEIEGQRERLAGGVEAEKAKMLAEAKQEVATEASKKRWHYQEELQRLADELSAANADLDDAIEELKDKRAELFKLDMQIRMKSTTIRGFMQQAIEELQKQGVPAMQCLQCPAFVFYRRTIGGMLSAVAAARPSPAPQQVQPPEPVAPAASAAPDQAQQPLQGPRADSHNP